MLYCSSHGVGRRGEARGDGAGRRARRRRRAARRAPASAPARRQRQHAAARAPRPPPRRSTAPARLARYLACTRILLSPFSEVVFGCFGREKISLELRLQVQNS